VAEPEQKPAEAQQEPAPTQKTAPPKTESLAKRTFGAPITESTETSLEDVVKDPAKFAGSTIRTTGVVQAVCKAAGCWMEIAKDGTSTRAHIKMAGHSFLVPKTADGHTAIVQGTVKAGEPQNDCGKKDSCGGEDNGALAKVELVATGVEFLD
jgi:hypothetical protein